VTLVERKEPVQTLAPHRPDHTLTEGIGLWRPHRRLPHASAHRLNRAINAGRVNRVAVMNEEAMGGRAGEDDPARLNRPGRGRMGRHMPMDDPPRADLPHHECLAGC
jgi:hypothetical protein